MKKKEILKQIKTFFEGIDQLLVDYQDENEIRETLFPEQNETDILTSKLLDLANLSNSIVTQITDFSEEKEGEKEKKIVGADELMEKLIVFVSDTYNSYANNSESDKNYAFYYSEYKIRYLQDLPVKFSVSIDEKNKYNFLSLLGAAYTFTKEKKFSASQAYTRWEFQTLFTDKIYQYIFEAEITEDIVNINNLLKISDRARVRYPTMCFLRFMGRHDDFRGEMYLNWYGKLYDEFLTNFTKFLSKIEKLDEEINSLKGLFKESLGELDSNQIIEAEKKRIVKTTSLTTLLLNIKVVNKRNTDFIKAQTKNWTNQRVVVGYKKGRPIAITNTEKIKSILEKSYKLLETIEQMALSFVLDSDDRAALELPEGNHTSLTYSS